MLTLEVGLTRVKCAGRWISQQGPQERSLDCRGDDYKKGHCQVIEPM